MGHFRSSACHHSGGGKPPHSTRACQAKAAWNEGSPVTTPILKPRRSILIRFFRNYEGGTQHQEIQISYRVCSFLLLSRDC